MLLTVPAHACDVKGCGRVTDRTCAFCGFDGCNQHLQTKWVSGVVFLACNGDDNKAMQATFNRDGGVWVCVKCGQKLESTLKDIPREMHLKAWREIEELLKAAWAAMALKEDAEEAEKP